MKLKRTVGLVLAYCVAMGQLLPAHADTPKDKQGTTSDAVFEQQIDVAQEKQAEETPSTAKSSNEEIVDANILVGKLPTTNSTTNVSGGGNSTASGIKIENPSYATDDDTSGSASDGETANLNTKLSAGEEKQGSNNNGYDGWQHIYVQYNFEKPRDVKEIKIYRNSYQHAKSTFKKVKVELSTTEDFKNSIIVFGDQDGVDYKETDRAQPQIIKLPKAINAQYIRVWQQGHYIENDDGGWKGMSSGVLFNEIQVIAAVPKSEVPEQPPETERRNIALNKIPYAWGQIPTNMEAISDGKFDDNYAIHNTTGDQWLQFEFKNRYKIKEIKFKLEPAQYQSIKVSIANNPTNGGANVVYEQSNWKQNDEIITVTVPNDGVSGQYIRFDVKKSDNEAVKYSEIQIFATGTSFDEEKPKYVAPPSRYTEMVWNDEFEGDKLDESKWQIIDGMANHGAIYNKGAVSVQNGNLVLNSKNYDTTENLIKAVGWDQYQNETLKKLVTWSSGRVESKNKFSFQFGRVAVRAKPNDTVGIWPAIWMLCQDETGHDEIDILEYLGKDPWDAWTTNHYGILENGKNSSGVPNKNYEAWCQDYHVFEVEWAPEQISFFIDGKKVHSTSDGKNDKDGMHTRPMFLILETQVGDGWVGPVDYSKRTTKQDSNFLIDWVRVYQEPKQPVARFDDLETIYDAPKQDGYLISPQEASKGLQQVTHKKDAEQWEDKDNFYYGGQPRVETHRVAPGKNITGEQYLVYHVEGAKDAHLTAYYQTIQGIKGGQSVRDHLDHGANIDFQIAISANGKEWKRFDNMKFVSNYQERYPGFARITFDAYNLPENTNYVKVIFPNVDGVKYNNGTGLLNTDVQLAKVTFMQEKQKNP